MRTREGGAVRKKAGRSGRGFNITRTRRVVRLASNVAPTCRDCKESFGSNPINLEEQINHYLGHGYILLHIGPDQHGTMNITVAMLGK